MQFLKEWAIALLVLGCVLSLFLGYFWRMHHESKNIGNWKKQAVAEFLYELTEPDTPEVSKFEGWIIIKRADGSIVIKRRVS